MEASMKPVADQAAGIGAERYIQIFKPIARHPGRWPDWSPSADRGMVAWRPRPSKDFDTTSLVTTLLPQRSPEQIGRPYSAQTELTSSDHPEAIRWFEPDWRGRMPAPIPWRMTKAAEIQDDGGLYEAVGARIRELRIAAGLTQEAFGAAAGMNAGFVWRVEAGRQNLSLKSIGRISLALDQPITALFEGIEPDASVMVPRRTSAPPARSEG